MKYSLLKYVSKPEPIYINYNIRRSRDGLLISRRKPKVIKLHARVPTKKYSHMHNSRMLQNFKIKITKNRSHSHLDFKVEKEILNGQKLKKIRAYILKIAYKAYFKIWKVNRKVLVLSKATNKYFGSKFERWMAEIIYANENRSSSSNQNQTESESSGHHDANPMSSTMQPRPVSVMSRNRGLIRDLSLGDRIARVNKKKTIIDSLRGRFIGIPKPNSTSTPTSLGKRLQNLQQNRYVLHPCLIHWKSILRTFLFESNIHCDSWIRILMASQSSLIHNLVS